MRGAASERSGALVDRRLLVRRLVLVDDALGRGLVELAARGSGEGARLVGVAGVGGLAEARTADFSADFTDLLRSCAASFCRLRLIWDLMFATGQASIVYRCCWSGCVARPGPGGPRTRPRNDYQRRGAEPPNRRLGRRAQVQPRRCAARPRSPPRYQRWCDPQLGRGVRRRLVAPGQEVAAEQGEHAVDRSGSTVRVSRAAASRASASIPSPYAGHQQADGVDPGGPEHRPFQSHR